MSGWLDTILSFIQENQVLLTALGLGGAGTIIFWLKGIPVGIYNILKRELTTEIVVTTQSRIFYDIIKLVEKMYKDKNLRKLKMTNGRWGEEEKTTISMGYGTHLLRYNGVFLMVTLVKNEANQSWNEKDTLTFVKAGRSRKVFEEIVVDAERMGLDKSKNRIYKMDDGWIYVKSQNKRTLDSIFIETEKKEYMTRTLDNFLSKEDWYGQRGIPYQLGILFYGPPGTGKTSLIKAIASYLDYDVYYLPASRLYKIENASATLPDNCLMVIEDIDANSVTKNRERTPENSSDPKDSESELILELMGEASLSELLNCLDGIFASHGRILLATTNHIEQLDQAIIRPGRFDVKVEVGYVNDEILDAFIKGFFPEDSGRKRRKGGIRDRVTVAELQNLILSGASKEDIVQHCYE